jgi:phasin family protein
MSTQNPFDFTNVFQNFDPQATIKQMQESFKFTSVPQFDAESFANSQRKNVELLMNTNKAVIEGSQALLQRQADMIQQSVAEATAAAEALTKSGSPEDVSKAQVELLQSAYEKALTNSAEISEMIKKTQDEIVEKVNTRVSESLAELKDAIQQAK